MGFVINICSFGIYNQLYTIITTYHSLYGTCKHNVDKQHMSDMTTQSGPREMVDLVEIIATIFDLAEANEA